MDTTQDWPTQSALTAGMVLQARFPSSRCTSIPWCVTPMVARCPSHWATSSTPFTSLKASLLRQAPASGCSTVVSCDLQKTHRHHISCCCCHGRDMPNILLPLLLSHGIVIITAFPFYSTAQHSTAQHSTAQHSTAQHSTAQHSTAQHSTAQHSTAQHSTAQHSTAQHSCRKEKQ